MDVECRYCHALHWLAEKTAASTAQAPEFGTCCNHGKVDLPILQKPPDALYQLFVRNDTQVRKLGHNMAIRVLI
jgi:hypothetical protein